MQMHQIISLKMFEKKKREKNHFLITAVLVKNSIKIPVTYKKWLT